MSEATIPIKELMEKTEQWLLGQGYKKSTLGFYRATSMIIFASCYSHAIFLTPAMALVCMIFGIHSQFIHWKNNFLMGMIPW